MEAKDLRIGNYIDYETEREIVTMQTTYEYLRLIHNGNKNFKPIPLTEEWFLKFGFEKLATDEPFFKRHKIEVLKYSKGNFFLLGGNHITYGIGLHDIWQGMEINIQHVHQLQNLYFALTNEELTL